MENLKIKEKDKKETNQNEIEGGYMDYLKNDELMFYNGELVPKEAVTHIEKMDTEILRVKNDTLFYHLFNESKMENIEWAVSKILDCDIEKVRNKVTVKNSKIPKENISEKQKNVDLLVETDKENSILIELNNNFNGDYKRNIFYCFNILLSKYKIGKKSKYEDINRMVIVNLNWHNTNISKKRESIVEDVLYYNEDRDDYLIKVINANLDKFEDIEYNDVINSNKFYKLLTIHKLKELMNVENKEKELKGYIKELAELSQNEAFRKDYMDEEMSEYLEKLAIIQEKKKAEEKSFNDGVQEGIEQGIEQGIMQTKIDMIINMAKKGLTLEDIKEISDLPLEKVKEIIDNNKNN